MNYEVHIKDTQNYSDPLVLHFAERGSITLNHLGGDDKTQPIVGSELVFTLENYDSADAKYSEYFTSDEKRFEVTQVYHDTQEVIWKGYLLPESYSEPYTRNVSYISFSATDGLGLLKGKRLPAEYYQEEKTVMQVIAACLELTNENFQIWLSPAIRNHLKRKWHEIYIDGLKWFDEDKNPSAYDFLEELIFSMRCQLYQANNRWFIEGINKRQLITQNFDVYNTSGQFLNVQEFTKRVIELDLAPEPNITTVPAYKEVIVSHEAAQLKFSEQLAKYKPRWSASKYAQYNYYYNPEWNFTDYYPEVLVENDLLLFPNYSQNTSVDFNRKIDLKVKPYILKGWKIEINMEFELRPLQGQQITDPSSSLMQSWIDMLIYRIRLNDSILFTNYQSQANSLVRLNFDKSLRAEVTLKFVAQENGLLDVELFEPTGNPSSTQIGGVYVKTLEIENIEQKENDVVITEIEETASQTNEFELPVSDDISSLSKCFYLEPIRELDESAITTIQVNIVNTFTLYDEKYYVLPLWAAVLIEAFAKETRAKITQPFTAWIDNLEIEVIYNHLQGEQMVVKTKPLQYNIDYFEVQVQPYKEETIDRAKWLEWTDDIYQVERLPYAKAVGNVEARLFAKSHLRVETDAHQAVFYNDIIKFKYQDELLYLYPINCGWNGDNNLSSLILIEGVYSGNSFGNLPPFVEAGEDRFLSDNDTSAITVGAQVFDPDGVIQNFIWEKLEGEGNGQILDYNAPNAFFGGLTGDYYKFQLTATDNAGASASDTMEIFRVQNSQIKVTEIYSDIVNTDLTQTKEVQYKIEIDPELLQDYVVVVDYKIFLENSSSGNGYIMVEERESSVLVENNSQVYNYELNNYDIQNQGNDFETTAQLTFTESTEIYVTVRTFVRALSMALFNVEGRAGAQFQIQNYNYSSGYGQIINLPITLERESVVIHN